jgi:hypothetical protein
VWQRLEVVATEAGDVGDEEGIVAFRATYEAEVPPVGLEPTLQGF